MREKIPRGASASSVKYWLKQAAMGSREAEVPVHRHGSLGPFAPGLLALTVGIEITERKQAEKKLRKSEQKLRCLASQLLNDMESERRRFSRELHDELGQSLLVLKLQVRRIERNLDIEQATLRKECQEMSSQLDQLVENVRRLSRNLSPRLLEDLGLSKALKYLIEESTRHYNLKAKISLVEDLDNLFSRDAEVNLYRIFQEALTNIAKYAQAYSVTVAITRKDDQVSILIADNGKGFDIGEVVRRSPASRGLGLVAMEERVHILGGSLEIRSQKDQGTKILFSIPIPK